MGDVDVEVGSERAPERDANAAVMSLFRVPSIFLSTSARYSTLPLLTSSGFVGKTILASREYFETFVDQFTGMVPRRNV